MKYYSEVLNQIFNSEEELEREEERYKATREAEMKAKEAEEKAKRDRQKQFEEEKAQAAAKVHALYDEVMELNKKYHKVMDEYEVAVDNYIRTYGSSEDNYLLSIINRLFS